MLSKGKWNLYFLYPSLNFISCSMPHAYSFQNVWIWCHMSTKSDEGDNFEVFFTQVSWSKCSEDIDELESVQQVQ